ncbi:MAG TPA: membrane protein insertase YidC [Candidatus Sulfopaludibacter sp.]|nr:membrane protein insertase YidC [Candidatus Sulfopaludibacter sp.]
MDRTGIIVVSLCVVLMGVWFVTEQKYYSQVARSPAGTNAPVNVQTPNAGAAPGTAPAVPTAGAGVPSGFSFDTNVPEQTIVLTRAHERYTFTSWGGGLKSVELTNYPETVSARWKQKTSAAGFATLNARVSEPVMAILGEASLIGDGNWTLIKTGDGVHAEKIFPNGLRIVKDFHIGADGLLNVTMELDNTSDKSLPLPTQEWVIGTATPMGPDDNNFPMYGGMMWYDGAREQQINLSYFSTNTTFLFFFPHTPKSEYREGSSNVVWAAAYNQFFVLLAMPRTPAAQVLARPVYLPAFTNVEWMPGLPLPEGIQTALVYPAQTLGTNQTIERQIVLYAGPKEYRTLAHIGAEFQNHADLAMNFGRGYMSFWGVGTFFAKVLLICMNWLHDAFKVSYGWTIVLITVLLRIAFWPLTAASTRSMKKMQALAPEIKALQAKYKDDMQKFTQKQWELYRKHKVSPMSGCLPMMIQMPVFFGFFTMLRSAIELRGAHFLWVSDLSKPDTLLMIPGLNFPFNLLPLLMVGVMVWQAHLQPPSPGMDPTQAKMMRYLPLIFLVFLYNYSSGMALYMTMSTLMSVIQTKFTKMNQTPAPAAATPALTPPPKKKK